MKRLLLLACTTALATGCYTYDNDVAEGDVMVEPSGADLAKDEVPGEVWSQDPRDMNQRPYRYQIESERHQQYDTDPDFTHDKLD